MDSDNPQKSTVSKIYVCTNFRSGVHSSCAQRGSKQIFKQLRTIAKESSVKIDVEEIVCLGQCEHGPNVRIAGKKIINGVGAEDLRAIVNSIIDGSANASNGVDE